MLRMIGRYRVRTGATVILVTHSMEIAAQMSDRILVLNKGSVAYFGTPQEIFSHAQDLIGMGLNVPSFTKIMIALRDLGYRVEDVYTVEAAAAQIKKLIKGENAV